MQDKIKITLSGVIKSISPAVLPQWLSMGWQEIKTEEPQVEVAPVTKKTVKPKPAVEEEVCREDIKGE
jgi:hypothetical protein